MLDDETIEKWRRDAVQDTPWQGVVAEHKDNARRLIVALDDLDKVREERDEHKRLAMIYYGRLAGGGESGDDDTPIVRFMLTCHNRSDRITVTEHDWRVEDFDGTLEREYHEERVTMERGVEIMRELRKKWCFDE